METPSPSEPFMRAVERLIEGLRDLHRSTSKTPFTDMAKAVAGRMEDWEAADFVQPYVDGEITSDKLAHFIEASYAYCLQACRLNDAMEGTGWPHLMQAYFLGGMSVMQYNAMRGAYLRTLPYRTLQDFIVGLIESKCAGMQWPTREALWMHLESDVVTANDRLNGEAGYSKNPRAVFDKLARERKDFFQQFLSRPSGGGRPPKTSKPQGAAGVRKAPGQ